jgi:ABC-type glycerol-3-phosphate transport system permease component
MSILLTPERRTARGKIFLAFVYSLLILGGLTMVYPFLVMLSAGFSNSFDYNRHSPYVKAVFDRNDRFVRSLATYFPRFPREIFPEAPKNWGSWITVARDIDGINAFASPLLSSLDNPQKLDEIKKRAASFRDASAKHDITRTTCSYDTRDVASFISKKTTLEEINRTWPIKYKSIFDISFSIESKEALWHKNWKPDLNNAKYRMWLDFKDSYRKNLKEGGDWVSKTMPYPLEKDSGVREALVMQFHEHGWRDFFKGAISNYRLVGDYLFLRGRAFFNTLILVILSVLAHLTVNPLAAYALSRFALKGTEKILLFLLATMAFPAAVTAIPGFLLVRDLGLLNTFAALVLPTIASGMSIFILKGFFDALPRELYEAASIDGAGEWLVFRKITLPMTTPILAVNALNSFIAAYNSWEWAFLVCQKESHWTLAVWMYQMSQHFSGQPWCVMAGFVLVSIPTAVVFLLCQKVILRGIVLPSMK